VRRIARLGVVLLALSAAAAMPGRAATLDREDGFLTAYAYALFPPGARLHVDPRDDAEEDLALLATFRRALERRGHVIDPAATLMLGYDLNIDDDVALAGREAEAGGPTVVVPIGRGSSGVRASTDLTRYRLSVVVDDRRSGRRLWSAEALFAADPRSAVAAAQAMVPVLLDSLGQTVNRLSITFE
jgi:hypothetical protein